MIKIIDEFSNLGGFYIVFTGGDPLLRTDFEEVFLYARKKRIAVSIMSSGFIYNEKVLETIADYGVMSFQISIHSTNEKKHDLFAGKSGSFSNILKTVMFLKSRGVSLYAAINITTLNIDEFDSIKNFCMENSLIPVFNFNMIKKRNGESSPLLLNISKNEIFQCVDSILPGKPRFRNISEDENPCSAGNSILSINPCGIVYPCIEIRETAGDVRHKSLAEIWNNSSVLKNLRDIKFKDLSNCPTCKFKEFCNRCAGFAVSQNHSILDYAASDCILAEAFYNKFKK